MTKRPVGVWLIFGYIAFTFLSLLASIGYTFFSDNPDVQWGRTYYQSLSAWQIAYFALNTIVSLSAAVSLLMLRRTALWLFSAILVLGIGNVVWQLLSGWLRREAADMIGTSGVSASIVVGFAISAGIVAYVWRLRVKGVLT